MILNRFGSKKTAATCWIDGYPVGSVPTDQELPKFIAEIKRIFEPQEIVELFDDLDAGLVPDPAKIFRADDVDEDGLNEFEVLNDAGKILLVQNAKALLLRSEKANGLE